MVLLSAAMLMRHATNVGSAGAVMVDMRSGAMLTLPGAGKRRGNRARELGEHEKPDEYADKGRNGPQPLHRH